MVKKALITDFFREVHKSRRKFLSLFALSALAVAFLAGLRCTQPDMWHSADVYYKNYNFMDLYIVSTLGLTDEDVDAFAEAEGVSAAEGSKSVDALTGGLTVSILSMPDNINELRLKEGRLPEAKNECVTEAALLEQLELNIGDTITLDLDGQEDILDNFEYKIVGICDNPLYVSLIRGSSSIGSGTISAWIDIPKENFINDVYSSIYLTLDNTDDLHAYEAPYDDYMSEMVEQIEPLADERLKIRHDKVITEGQQEIDDGWEEYYEEKEKADKELSDAEKELSEAAKEIQDGVQELNDAYDELTENEAKLADAKEQIDEADKKLSDGKKDLDKLKELIDGISSAASSGDTSTSVAGTEDLSQYEGALNSIGVTVSELENLNESNYMSVMGKIRKAYFEGIAEYQSGMAQLQDARKKYMSGVIQINEGWEEFEKGLTELEEGNKEYQDGLSEYNDAKKEADEEFADAYNELTDAQKKLDDLGDGDIYVLDRNSNIGYVGFGQDSERMGNLSQVFPVIFFLVAALSCLTTVTRMIEENRTEIGTLKALGYGKLPISIKYIGYAASASFLGGVFGAIVGCTGIPFFIYFAWMIMYFFPPIQYMLQLNIIVPAIMTAVLALTITATIACMSTLVDTPASLMRPRAPKPGKRIFLEHITFIWKRMRFTHKVAARNLFRFKQRFWMTVIGIGGCAGLLVTGIGLHDSIFDILNLQFDEITVYDASITVDSDISESDMHAITDELDTNSNVEDYYSLYQGSVDAYSGKSVVEGVSIVPVDEKDIDKFSDYYDLRHRLNDDVVTLRDDGVIINEKLADLLDIEAGDNMDIMLDDDRRFTVKVVDTTENYVYHYIYLTENYYKSITGDELSDNLILVKTTENADIDALSAAIIAMDDVTSFSKINEMRDRFEDSFNSVDYAVIIIVVSAAALAFIVLYNLMNINITERERELATLKVIGFTDSETAVYTYRENMIMTLIGIFLGMFFGKYLHSWLIGTIEISQVMFGRSVHSNSFLYASLLTFAFALIVNSFAYFSIRKINMVESLKSAE